MFGFQASVKKHSDKILNRLSEFEDYCMAKKNISPENFRALNRELSRLTVENIGKCQYKNASDGTHLLWTGLDHREHDLGNVDSLNVMQNYPGFHKSRTHALGKDEVESSALMTIPGKRAQVTIVKMKDGTTGIGTDYKIALRNAALKMHLKRSFNKNSTLDKWKKLYSGS